MINVLIVEDDPMVAMLNSQYLSQISGFDCVGKASSLNEADSLLRRLNVDLVLLDIYLMGDNGLDLLSGLTSKTPGIDVIMISAAADGASIGRALRHGAIDYLIKPFTFERFRQALERYSGGKELMSPEVSLCQAQVDQWLVGEGPNSLQNPSSAPLLKSASRPETSPPYQPQSFLRQAELPKGLTPATLQLVAEGIAETGGKWFSTRELADHIGISRISTRKYLEHLLSLKQLATRQQYQSTGRPLSQYRTPSS
ncbi:response regulator [Paenibacillus sp. CAU 1782]